MSSSLDKLKALTSRLEEKLEQKEEHSNPNDKEVIVSEEVLVSKPVKQIGIPKFLLCRPGKKYI